MTQAGYVVFCLVQFVPLGLQLCGLDMNGWVLLFMTLTGILAIIVGLRLRKLHVHPASEVLDASSGVGGSMSDRMWNATIFLQFLIVLQLIVMVFAAGVILVLDNHDWNFHMPSPERAAFFVQVMFGLLVLWTATTALALSYVVRKRRRHEVIVGADKD